MRRFAVWLTMLFLLTGCAVPWSRESGAVLSLPKCSPPAEAAFPVAKAKGTLRPGTIAQGEPLPGPGAYFLEVGTGEVEAWQTDGSFLLRATADPAWLSAVVGDTQYLIRRASGATYCWPAGSLRLIAASLDTLLFRGPDGAFTLADAELKSVHTFTLESGDSPEALFSPDGKQVAINPWRSTAPPPGGPLLYLVDVAQGTVKPLLGEPLTRVQEAALHPGPSLSLRLTAVNQAGEAVGDFYLLRRFGWDGEAKGDQVVASPTLALSPDGEQVAAEVSLDGFSTGVVVYDAASGAALYRVLGAQSPAWTADGYALLLRDGGGRTWQANLQGMLRQSPLDAVANGFLHRLTPSPTDPDRFLAVDVMAGKDWTGLQVVDGAGKVVHALNAGETPLYLQGSWVPSGLEVAFSLWAGGGKDYGQPGFHLAPAVEAPATDSPFFLMVLDEAGDCLNLRTAPTTEAGALRCLPTGTPLAIADPADWGEKATGPVAVPKADKPGEAWLAVRTQGGETGWVALFTNSVNWAAAAE